MTWRPTVAILALLIGCSTESPSADATTCDQPKPDSQCIPGCTGATDVFIGVECIDGAWRCPDGTTRFEDCPLGTCRTNTVTCCDPVTRDPIPRVCYETGYGGGCEGFTVLQGYRCTDHGIPACPCPRTDPSCDIPCSLFTCPIGALAEGEACTVAGSSCSYGGECEHVQCTCTETDGGLVWSCARNC
jgi:hypothetical protein